MKLQANVLKYGYEITDEENGGWSIVVCESPGRDEKCGLAVIYNEVDGSVTAHQYPRVGVIQICNVLYHTTFELLCDWNNQADREEVSVFVEQAFDRSRYKRGHTKAIQEIIKRQNQDLQLREHEKCTQRPSDT